MELVDIINYYSLAENGSSGLAEMKVIGLTKV